ncbi:permease-like cell division protein FtsX [Kibdelosporangium lantanae]|uniref:Permease-like cell division protein FtsX n=1 Tax=Kibdelosporangium lantanae TaxID=1497396 RepID=A0ABW3M8Q8_9PSEU
MKLRVVVVAAILVAAAAVTTVLILNRDDATADANVCRTITLFFRTDEAMAKAVDQLRGDPDVTAIVAETKQQAYERFKKVYADQPELLELTRPEAIRATVALEPAHNTNRQTLIDRLRQTYPAQEVQDSCEHVDRVGNR